MQKDPDSSKSRYPYGVFLFLLFMFCEVYCASCYKTIIALYYTEQLRLSKTRTTIIFHAYLTVANFAPLLGGVLADAWLGTFWAITNISLIYAVGNILSCLSAFPLTLGYRKALSFVGLFLAAIGQGGLKPCNAVFGGDQFGEDQVLQRQQFYSIFYAVFSAATITATLVSPELRGDFKCFEEDTCYPLAFGFSAAIFIVSWIVFAIFKPFYKTPKAEGKVFISVFKCIGHALITKIKSKGETREHWLDYAADKYDELLIRDVKDLIRVCRMFIPLPIFWALFEQQGSTWLLQSVSMDAEFMGIQIKPDHMLLVNPVLIVLMMPVFEYLIYPTLFKLRLCRTDLQKMIVGGLLTATAFIMSGFIEIQIEANIPDKMPPGITEVSILNNSPCWLNIQGDKSHEIKPFGDRVIWVTMTKKKRLEIKPSHCFVTKSYDTNFNFDSHFMKMLVTLSNDALHVTLSEKKMVDDVLPTMKIFFSTDYKFNATKTGSFLVEGDSKSYYAKPISSSAPVSVGETNILKNIQPGDYRIYLPYNETLHYQEPIGKATFKRGGNYILGIFEDSRRNMSNLSTFILISPYSVSILFQLPQIIVLTAGEIMFVVTGMDFSYSQAPNSLKSVVQSVWLIAIAIGNALVISIENYFAFEKQSNQFFMYAVLLISSMTVFAVLGYFYEYVEDR